MKSYDELSLGEVIWEAVPWEGKIHRRYVARIQTEQDWDGVFDKPKCLIRVFWASDRVWRIGEQITKENWGVRFFPGGEKELARRVCCERAVALKAEQREQLEKERADLEKQLKELDGPAV